MLAFLTVLLYCIVPFITAKVSLFTDISQKAFVLQLVLAQFKFQNDPKMIKM